MRQEIACATSLLLGIERPTAAAVNREKSIGGHFPVELRFHGHGAKNGDVLVADRLDS